MKAHAIAVCSIIFAALVAVNGIDPPKVRGQGKLTRFEFSEPHMGTTFRLIFYAPDEAVAKKAAKQAFARIADLNNIMSDYLDDSELMRLCKKPGEWVQVSDDLFHVLSAARRISEKSDGAFDVTVGPVVRLWRRARRTLEMPSPDALKKALALVNYRNVELDPATHSVRLRIEGMLLDLGGIAKGDAAQAALEILLCFGFNHALVAAGGDIVVADAPPDAKGWRVALETPDKDAPATMLLLTNAAVSTSGDANQFVTIDGKRYSHIVDPRTGLGLVGRRAVSVVAKKGSQSDGYATAVCVLGIERGMKLIEETPDLAARIVEVGEKTRIVESTRFGKFVVPK
jgi:thiamine biosynthesis lipoprotein